MANMCGSQTDVPISYNNTSVPDYLTGKWKYEDQDGQRTYYEVYKKESATFVKFFDELNKLEYESPLYFYKQGNTEYISYFDSSSKTSYSTCIVEKVKNSNIKLFLFEILVDEHKELVEEYNIPRDRIFEYKFKSVKKKKNQEIYKEPKTRPGLVSK
jgi:hypothetical protein